MITFIAHLKVRPENGLAFEALMKGVRDLTLANEPGVVYYEFSRSVDEANTYLVVEVYRDPAAHGVHMETPWVIDSIPVSRELIDGPAQIRQYVTPGAEPTVRRTKDN